jgi:hypothetical protein
MSRNGSGTYSLPAGNPVVTGTTISSTWANSTLTDIAATLTDSVAADGQTPMTGNLNLSNNKIVNVTDPTLAQDATTKAYVDAKTNGTSAGSFTTVTTGAGTVSAPAITTTGDTNTGIFFPAADTIAFTEGGVESVRIDNAGRVGIGTSNPAATLQVTTAGDTFVISETTGSGSGGKNSTFQLRNPNQTWNIQSGFDSNNSFRIFDVTANAERFTINSGGNVGIGTTTPDNPLTVVASSTTGSTCISTSSGSIDATGGQIGMTNTYAGTPNNSKALRINNQGDFEIVNDAYTTVILRVTDAGSTFNVTGTYGTISDVRIKDNVETARDYLSDLCRLRVVKYSLKSEKSQVPTKLGFVAQEVEQVFPNMVEESLDTFGDLGNIKQIKLSVLTPMLVKAIQELKSELDSVKAELATLKA